MATEASVWRLEVASKIAQTYARHRLVKAVSAYGSAAYGTADDLSDLDLKVYWDAPDLECVYEVASPGASLASHRSHLRGTTEHTETFQNAGLRVGMHHVTVTEFETFTDDVLERCDIDDAKQIELSLMVMERPLFGDRYIDYWKAKAAQYPQPLAEKMVQEHLSFYQRSVLENLVRDSASLALQLHIFCRMAENVVGVLLGLNRIYGSVLNVKLLNGWIAGMRLVPADFLPAINCFTTRGTSPSLVRIAAIIDEVLDLAATHMPTTAAFGAWQRFGMPVPRLTTDAASRLARKIGHHYRRSPDVRAVLLVPPCSMDHAGVRVMVFWDSSTHAEIDHASMTRLGATRVGWRAESESAEVFEEFLLDGACVAIGHTTADSATRLIDDVMHGDRTDPGALEAISLLFDGRPLHGDDVIQRWKSQARPYPEPLARSMMARHLIFYSKWSLENRVAGRGHRFYAYQLMSMMVENVIGILLAINGIYGAVGDVGNYQRWISRMKVRPHRLWQRINRALGLGIPECIHAMDPIIRETLELVARHMPQESMRDILNRYEESWRPCCDPPGSPSQPLGQISNP